MKVLKHGGLAIACAASVVLSALTLFLCKVWLSGNASLVQSPALIAASALVSGIIALMEFR